MQGGLLQHVLLLRTALLEIENGGRVYGSLLFGICEMLSLNLAINGPGYEMLKPIAT